MPVPRPVLALAAVLAVATGCTSTIAGSGAPAAGLASSPARAPASRAAAPTPTATYNGVASMSGDDALGTAYYALQHAPTVRLKAILKGGNPWTLELCYRGIDSDGTYSIDGMTVQIRKVGRSVYRKASQQYWRSRLGPAAARLPAGKWIKVPVTDKSLTDLADLLRKDQMADAFLGLSGTLSTGGVFKTVNGVETVPVISDGPEKETAYVAIVGEPYPVRIETGTDVGSVDFLDYGRPVTSTAPPASQVAEFDALPTG